MNPDTKKILTRAAAIFILPFGFIPSTLYLIGALVFGKKHHVKHQVEHMKDIHKQVKTHTKEIKKELKKTC